MMDVPAEHSSGGGAPAATTFLLLSGKSAQDQQLLASAAGELSLAEEGGGELAVSLALDASGDAGYDAAAYMGALQVRRFGRWMRWSPRMASTDDLVIQNFAKLPVGVVCATYMQFKGRGNYGGLMLTELYSKLSECIAD
nr:biotin--protein ligase 1, chloroplastic [Aegilops tauschii subsp. strangulata]